MFINLDVRHFLNRLGFLAFVCLFWSVVPAYTQKSPFSFKNLSISDGLSQSSVISITQDKAGLMWFGTRDGLNKYDGHTFKQYKHNSKDASTISSNDITKLLVDSHGDLWVGTFYGLNKLDYGLDRFTRFIHGKANVSGISDNIILSIYEARNGDIWIGTANGLNRYDRKRKRFVTFYHNPENVNSISSDFVQDILEDKEGVFWLATDRGLNRMTLDVKGNARFTRYVNNLKETNTISDNTAQVLTDAGDGDLWIGTKYGGLNRFNRKTGRFHSYKNAEGEPTSLSHNDVRSLVLGRNGKLWIGTYAGLNILDPKTNRFQRVVNDKGDPTSLSRNAIKSIFVDRKGSVWVGTYYGGISLLDAQNSNFKNYKYRTGNSGLSFDVVSAIKEDKKGNLYIGTEGGGVNILNQQTKTFSYIKKDNTPNSITSNNVKSLYLDNRENLLIGTFNGGLNIVNLKTGSITKYKNDVNHQFSITNDNIYSIVPQNDSMFWLGTHGGGLNLFNRNTGRATALKEGATNLTSNLVRTVLKDSKGNLWVGTQYGLNYLPADKATSLNPKFKRYLYDEKKQTGDDILMIFEDSQARIWVGTNVKGLSMFHSATDSFVTYNLSKMTGSVSNLVHGIQEDGNHNLWVSTNQGIIKFNPANHTFKVYDEADGVISNEFNNNSCLRDSNGYLYFGSLTGMTSFHPDSLYINKYAPAVVLTDLKLFGKSVKPDGKGSVLESAISVTDKIVLDYDQAIFTIDFALPNFVNGQKNHYAFRLRGLEEKWNYTSNKSATYTIQASGDYVFEVKGANNDGVWTKKPTLLQVRVNPAPWLTWWAYLIYGLMALAAVYVLVNILLSRSKLRHELELEHLDKQRQESLNQTKIQFFTNVSHEFRTPLTLILAPLEQIISRFRGDQDTYKQLLTIENNANRLRILIDELMDFRKYENNGLQLRASEGNIVKFVEEVYSSFCQFAEIQKHIYVFRGDRERIQVWFDHEKLERVLLNLISNAFKYTPGGGQIEVSVTQLQGEVEIRITDNGIGIETEHLEKIFDRFYEVDQKANLLITKYNKGTGIGLALAKGIVNLHSGKIKVESKQNEGSSFAVLLPLGKEHLQGDQLINRTKAADDTIRSETRTVVPPEQEEPEIVHETQPRFTHSVLVVEDNEELRQFISQLFKDDYQVLEATNGKEGLELALQHTPDIIISDVMMPLMDGIDFCAQVKATLETCHIPFILLTARTSQHFKHEGLEKGADDYLSKPFNAKELTIKVRNLISTQVRLKKKFMGQTVVKPSEITVSSLDEKLLEKALVIVEENISNEMFDIAAFCEQLGVSRTMLFAKVKAWTNLTPNEFIHAMRMKRAAQLLEQNKLNISEVGYEVGFRNPKYFSKCFHKHFSETPSSYAKRFINPKVVES